MPDGQGLVRGQGLIPRYISVFGAEHLVQGAWNEIPFPDDTDDLGERLGIIPAVAVQDHDAARVHTLLHSIGHVLCGDAWIPTSGIEVPRA